MTSYSYQNNKLFIENIPVIPLLQAIGTPAYIYSHQKLQENIQQWQDGLKLSKIQAYNPRLYFAVKANSNLHILKILNNLQIGFDTVSIGEIKRIESVCGNLERVVFSGVGKLNEELSYAISKNIYCINIESQSEFEEILKISKQLSRKARIAFRINPDIGVDSHPFLSTGGDKNKFGLSPNVALPLIHKALEDEYIDFLGLSMHLGSQLNSSEPLIKGLKVLNSLLNSLPNTVKIQYLNLGGGLGISYDGSSFLTPKEYLSSIPEHLPANHRLSQNFNLIFEPGRSLIASAGFLATKVIHLKATHAHKFCIVDAAMNDLMRPALYQAKHGVLEARISTEPKQTYTLCGPICESGDIFQSDIDLSVDTNDYLLFKDAGAYGFSMSSNYNSRLRPCEVYINQNAPTLIRERESFEYLFQPERTPRVIPF